MKLTFCIKTTDSLCLCCRQKVMQGSSAKLKESPTLNNFYSWKKESWHENTVWCVVRVHFLTAVIPLVYHKVHLAGRHDFLSQNSESLLYKEYVSYLCFLFSLHKLNIYWLHCWNSDYVPDCKVPFPLVKCCICWPFKLHQSLDLSQEQELIAGDMELQEAW